MKHFALVYCDYEGLYLLELGDKDFIKYKYDEYKSKIIEFQEKYEKEFPDELDLPNEYYNNPLSRYNNLNRLCIQGYDDNNKIKCMCKKFGISNLERIFY